MNENQKPMLNIENDPTMRELHKLSVVELMHLLSKDTKRYQVNSDFLLREVAGEYLLIPTGSSADSINGMISLNETFYFIWKQFEEPRTIYEVILATKEEYSDDTGRLEKDIYQFVLESVRLEFIKEEE